MPYTVAYRPSKKRPGRPWAKIAKRTGRITSRHKTKSKARASIRAYYASRHAGNLACNHNGHHHSLALNARRNPLRKDPTRTTMIQRKFMSEIRKRFARLKAKVKEFLDTHDALGMKVTTTHIILHAQPREFQFRTDAGKLSAFNDFLRQQTEANLLSVPPGTPEGLPWTAGYIESAYKRGLLNAYLSSKEGQLFEAAGIGEQTQEQFLRSAFLAPEALSKVQLLATRSFEQLKGVSATMGSELNRILSQGMIDGSGPAAIAREISDKIDSLSRSRAMTIARTEVVNAHAEGQLDAFDRLGVQELGIRAEWSTAGDDRVCPLCQELEGQVFDMEEARGMIPYHPNCRCAWIPTTSNSKEAQK